MVNSPRMLKRRRNAIVTALLYIIFIQVLSKAGNLHPSTLEFSISIQLAGY